MIMRHAPLFSRVLLIAFLVICAPANAQDVLTPNNEPAAIAPVTVEPSVADDKIAQRLEDIMDATGWYQIASVSVDDGIVYLDGATTTQDHRRWAESLAQNTEGVVAVVNRLEIDAGFTNTFSRAGDEVLKLVGSIAESGPLFLLGIVVIVVSWFVARGVASLARMLLAGSVPSPLLLSVIVRAISIPVFLLGLYLVLQVAGLTNLALTLLGGTGILGIIIGFAFRDIAENFLASLLLSIRNPFRMGDLIEVDGFEGIVQNLNTRSTVLLTLDGNHVQIPNARVFKSVIKNYSSIPSRRAEFVVGIGYDSSVGKAQRLIASVLNNHPAVLQDPEPVVLVDQLGDATINMKVHYWFDSVSYSPGKINSALLRLTKNTLLEGGIEMPDPAREVVFPQGVPVINQDGSKPSARKPAKISKVDTSDSATATPEEGDLESEFKAIDAESRPTVPEAGENLLK